MLTFKPQVEIEPQPVEERVEEGRKRKGKSGVEDVEQEIWM